MAARLLTFRGKHPDLITGQMYSFRDYAKAANITPKAMATRLNQVVDVTDGHLRPLNQSYNYEGNSVDRGSRNIAGRNQTRFTTRAEQVSGEWITKRLTK